MLSLYQIPGKRLSEKAESLHKNLELLPHIICLPWKGSVIMHAGTSTILLKLMGTAPRDYYMPIATSQKR